MPRKVTKTVEEEVWVDHNGHEHSDIKSAVNADAWGMLCAANACDADLLPLLHSNEPRHTLRAAVDMADEAYGTGPHADADNPKPSIQHEVESEVLSECEQAKLELERLLWGAVANAGRLSSERKPRWSHVVDALGVGSTTAHGLCRRFGFDPDEERGTPQSTRDEVEEVIGAPAQVWVDGDAAIEVLKLREENEDLRKQLNSCHERAADLAGHYRKLVQERDDLQNEVERLKGSAAEVALDAIAKLCGCSEWEYPGQVVRDVEALKSEVSLLKSEVADLMESRDNLQGEVVILNRQLRECTPPFVGCDKAEGDVMDLSAPGMRAHCEQERPGESRVQMRRVDNGHDIADVTVHPINDEDLTEATLEVVSGLYFSWWRNEVKNGRVHR